MSEHAHEGTDRPDRKQDEQREFLSYVWGVGLALVLTLVPFALVRMATARSAVLIAIGALALAQMVVHFRFFLHLGLQRAREDLQLILFSALLLLIMVAGTIWIMASLATRVGMPGVRHRYSSSLSTLIEFRQGEDGMDQRKMAERLRIVSRQPSPRQIVFLR